VEIGEQRPEESGRLIPEVKWKWVKAEVRKRIRRLSRRVKVE
jgi:hypothetical protein